VGKEVCVLFPVHWNGRGGSLRLPLLIKIWQNGKRVDYVRFGWQIKFAHERESVDAAEFGGYLEKGVTVNPPRLVMSLSP
jgi:hypothetical protein